MDALFEEDDEEFIEFLERRRRQRIIKVRPNYFDLYEDFEFRKRFRLSKESVMTIFDAIKDRIAPPSERNNSIPPLARFLMTLRFYATGNFLITVADFGGVSTSAASYVVKIVSNALYRVRRHYITFPNDGNEIRRKQQEFFDIARFPKVIGAIDCTHIRIQSPGGEEPELFRNRKTYFSLNVQTISSAKLKIMDLDVNWPGSSHDQTIFINSEIYRKFENREFKNALLVGDSGYANTSYLVTPLLNPNSAEELLYNESIIRTRNVVERSYGVWKHRFPVLHLGLRLKLSTIRKIIWATGVLHNIAIEEGEELPEEEFEYDGESDEVPVEAVATYGYEDTRRLLINNYFKNLLR